MELKFNDMNGVELKPGDTVLRAIGSKLVERRIESITFSACTKMGADGVTPEPSFSVIAETTGEGRRSRWDRNRERPGRYDKGPLYQHTTVIKKTAV